MVGQRHQSNPDRRTMERGEHALGVPGQAPVPSLGPASMLKILVSASSLVFLAEQDDAVGDFPAVFTQGRQKALLYRLNLVMDAESLEHRKTEGSPQPL